MSDLADRTQVISAMRDQSDRSGQCVFISFRRQSDHCFRNLLDLLPEISSEG